MPKAVDPDLKEQIRIAYISTGLNAEDLSRKFSNDKFSVTSRTIRNWITVDKWDFMRQATNVIELEKAPKRERIIARAAERGKASLDICELVISDLMTEITHGDIQHKDKAAIANSLKQWVEFRNKLKPQTIEEVVDLLVVQLVEWKLSPGALVTELRSRWDANRAKQ